MMKLIKIGAIAGLLVTGQALAQNSQIVYTLELGGDNHAASWKSPTPNCNVNNLYPPFSSTAGGTLDGQSFTAGTIVTWAAQVAVSGNVAGNAASGAANLVASLELHHDSATGALVTEMVHATLNGSGIPTTTGWYSTINNNVCTGSRYITCGEPCENREDAAFADAWQIDGGNPTKSRAIDIPDNNGPYLDYFQYPSDSGHPAASTAAAGTLLGIGCGYSKYAGYGCPSACGFGAGLNTAGVGMTAVSCGVALGKGPVFEGQMNTSGLLDGTYVLVLVPGTGNNVLKGGFSCDDSDPNSFALAPDDPNNPVTGDTITFKIGGGTVIRTITAGGWRSVKTHTADGELPIVLDPAATGSTTTKPKTESRGTSGTNQGVLKVNVVFDGAITLASSANITVTYRPTIQPPAAAVGSPTGVIPTSVSVVSTNTLSMTFASGLLPNLGCVNINIGAGTLVETIAGDADCNIRVLASDVTSAAGGSGSVTSADYLFLKSQITAGQTAVARPDEDINLSGGLIALSDELAAKAQVIANAKTALCP